MTPWMRLTTSRPFGHQVAQHVPRSMFHQAQTQPLTGTADLNSFNWMPRNRRFSEWLLHKPRSATHFDFRHFATNHIVMSPAPLNSPSDEQPPHAVAVYCGASLGTEAAFHHAAVCKTSALLAFSGDSRGFFFHLL